MDKPMEEIREVNEDKYESVVKDAKTIQFEEAKEKWQHKRLQEVQSMK